MKTELLHVVALSASSSAVIHASYEPCRTSSLGHCSHVPVLSTIPTMCKIMVLWYLYHAQVKIVLGMGNKRDENPWMLSDANYASKTKNAGLPGIDYDPRPVKYRLVTPDHINHFATNLQIILQNTNGAIPMWETQLQTIYKHYNLTCDQSRLFLQQVTILLTNLKLETLREMQGTSSRVCHRSGFVKGN